MSDEKNMQETQQPPPPVYYSTPTAPYAYPQNPTTPAPAFPVPVQVVPVSSAVAGKQYQEQLFAACARGQHDRTTKFGLCGILTAIFCFPIGLICLCADAEHKCARCGVPLN